LATFIGEGDVHCCSCTPDARSIVIRTKLNPNPADITIVMGDIAKLLDASITGVDMPAKPAPVMDLSKIDFDALRKMFGGVRALLRKLY